MELCNLNSITINNSTITRIETSYNPNLKNRVTVLPSQNAVEQLFEEKFSQSTFIMKHYETMTYDKSDVVDNRVDLYGYTITNNEIIISDTSRNLIYVSKFYYINNSCVINHVDTINVNKSIDRLMLSRFFTNIEIKNNSGEILNVYYPHLSLSEQLSEDCFYILGHGYTCFEQGINETTVIDNCAGIVLGKDYFGGVVDVSKRYGDFRNVEKVFIYNNCIPTSLVVRNEKTNLISTVLNINPEKIFFYNNINDIYFINNTSEKDFETTNIITPESSIIDIDTVSNGKRFVLDCSKLKNSITIVRSKSSTSENYLLTGLLLGNDVNNLNGSLQNCVSLNTIQTRFLLENMFFNCCSLQNVDITDVESIPNGAFKNCFSMRSIQLPDLITSIGNYAFQNCYCLRIINLNSSITNIGTGAFEGCNCLNNIYINSINESAFNGCNSLCNITLTTNIKTISNRAFENCICIDSIEIPNSVTYIGENSFNGCCRIHTLNIPTTVKVIDTSAFYGCYSLNTLQIPSSVTYLGENAFSNCFNIKNVTCLMTTNAGFFSSTDGNATNVRFVALESSFNDMFGYTSSETEIIEYTSETVTLDGTYTKDIILKPKSGVTFSKGFKLIKGGNIYARLVGVELANGITTLGTTGTDAVFRDCYALTSITMPSTLTYVFANSFQNCYSLTALPNLNYIKYLGNYSFSNCINISTIEIPSNVTTFGSYLFQNCAVESVTIPSHIKNVTEGFFNSCFKLTSVTIPTITTSIYYGAFESCYNIESIELPTSVTTIGKNAFNYCYGLREITLSKNLANIGVNAFKCCRGLTDLVIPYTVTTLEEGAFENCEALKSIIIPGYKIAINAGVFNNCYSLENVVCLATNNAICYSLTNANVDILKMNSMASERTKENLKMIFGAKITAEEDTETVYYSGANPVIDFSKTYNKSVIMLPDPEDTPIGTISKTGSGGNLENKLISLQLDGITTIAGGSSGIYGIFSNCSALTSLDLKSSLEKVGNYAFYNCNSLESVTIPDSVTMLTTCIFGRCSTLKSVKIPDSTPDLKGNMFSECVKLKNINMPTTLTEIFGHVFNMCYSLQSVTLPDSIKSLGSNAFRSCYSLSSINLPTGLTNIGESAFEGCGSLTSINFPSGLIVIGKKAYNNCYSINNISIPSTVTSFGDSAFGNSYGLKHVTCLITRLTTIVSPANCKVSELILNDSADSETKSKFTTMFGYVSPGVLDIVYTTNTILLKSIYDTDIALNPSSSTFSGTLSITKDGNSKTRLISCNVAEGIVMIGSYAFQNCCALSSITIPTTVTNINNYAFENCYSLKSISLPQTLKNISSHLFGGCYNLVDVSIPSEVTAIESYAFSNCRCLKSINIPSSVTTIGGYAFNFCYSMESISIASSVRSLGLNLFYGCYSLDNVTCLVVSNSSNYYTNFGNSVKRLVLNKKAPNVLKINLSGMFGNTSYIEV